MPRKLMFVGARPQKLNDLRKVRVVLVPCFGHVRDSDRVPDVVKNFIRSAIELFR